ILRYIDLTRERGRAEDAKVERVHDMLIDPHRRGDALRCFELDDMALAVNDGQRVALAALAARDGQDGCAIETAGEKDDGAGHLGRLSPAVIAHSMAMTAARSWEMWIAFKRIPERDGSVYVGGVIAAAV